MTPLLSFEHASLAALASNLSLVDELYLQYQSNPEQVDASWRNLFEGKQPAASVAATSTEIASADAQFVAQALALVQAHRAHGHKEAHLDPLEQTPVLACPALQPQTYGLTESDLDQPFPAVQVPELEVFQGQSLRAVVASLRNVYCGWAGVEYMHIDDPEKQAWMRKQWEQASLEPNAAAKTRLLDRLLAAESFEQFLHTKYVAAKRFSLEGGESLIPLLENMLEIVGAQQTQEVVLGMPHRGRLNVLTNLLGKAPKQIFSEFDDLQPETVLGTGDVKYHLGHSTEHTTQSGHKLHLSLSFNPSHLEAVDAVVLGRVRAKQDRLQDTERTKVLGILMHGDAAFMGQGIVAETFNFSETRAYKTGGTLHVVVNNQVGFTTQPSDARSSRYCTDVAKMLQIPIFHVNGDHPEEVVRVGMMAAQYQQTFHTDVIVDLVCYRKYGHNESDEPSFTQPQMYQKIASQPSVATKYAQQLINEKILSQDQLATMTKQHQQRLETNLAEARTEAKRPKPSALEGVWAGYQAETDEPLESVDTHISDKDIQQISTQITNIPPTWNINPKLARLLQQRQAMGQGDQPLDWGMGEALAFASLLSQGTSIRFTGQDCMRGTFSHRQDVLVDTKTGAEFFPLRNLSSLSEKPVGAFRIFNSTLSEFAVMGFEYGYSLDFPESLVLWEAQFGDFVNGAQVVIDQFLSAGADKWRRYSGLVLLLPHGYEGQGPEHSSARLERFLQLCARNNMQVAHPTTPAQYFHLLRRQVLAPWRKPLVVMTPKSLLRHPKATSSLADFTQGAFQTVLEEGIEDRKQIKRLVLCTGKIYYDLLEERTKRKDTSTALIRLEQLYPLDAKSLKKMLSAYKEGTDIVWAQEEPANMGAASFIMPKLTALAPAIRLASRPEAASPATGSHKAHALEQAALFAEIFRDATPTIDKNLKKGHK